MKVVASVDSGSQNAVIACLRKSIVGGTDWFTSIVRAVAMWPTPEEWYRGRRYNYFIEGEAFDWMLLVERLCAELNTLVPRDQIEEILFSDRFFSRYSLSEIADLLGVEKYRAYLNYYYGVVVEEALQLATEMEVHKRHSGNGIRYVDDYSEESHVKIYGRSRKSLLDAYCKDKGFPLMSSMSVGEVREFTYWLFKYRTNSSDSAKIASDTKKGLEQLQRMKESFEIPLCLSG